MRALSYDSFGGVDMLALQDVPRPIVADDEVLIRVSAASLNPFDAKLRSGQLSGFFEVDFPITPGRDGCGEVVSVGGSLADAPDAELKPGDRVCFISSEIQHGALAEFVAVKANGFVVPAPEGVTDVDRADFTKVVSGCDVVFDTVGGPVREESYKVLNGGGCLVFLIAEPVKDVPVRDDVRTRQVMVLDRVVNLRHVMGLAAQGIIAAEVAAALPLTEFGDAFRLLESGNAGGKVVVELRGDNREP